LVTAPKLKAWLYRQISEIAAWNDGQALDPGGPVAIYSESSEALDRLSAYILRLPENDARLRMLAEAYPPHRSIDELHSLNLEGRCASFGPNGFSGNNPSLWLSEYVLSELPNARGLTGYLGQ
jgi:hypothetical protein